MLRQGRGFPKYCWQVQKLWVSFILTTQFFIVSRPIKEALMQLVQISSEVTVKLLCWLLIQLFTRNGAPLSEKPTWSPTIEPNQTPTPRCPLPKSSSIMHWKKAIEQAPLLVASRPTLNCSMRPHGRQRRILTLILLELSIGTDIIKINHSTRVYWLIPAEEWRKISKFTIFKMSTQRLTGNQGLQRPRSMHQDKALSMRENSISRCD